MYEREGVAFKIFRFREPVVTDQIKRYLTQARSGKFPAKIDHAAEVTDLLAKLMLLNNDKVNKQQ